MSTKLLPIRSCGPMRCSFQGSTLIALAIIFFIFFVFTRCGKRWQGAPQAFSSRYIRRLRLSFGRLSMLISFYQMFQIKKQKFLTTMIWAALNEKNTRLNFVIVQTDAELELVYLFICFFSLYCVTMRIFKLIYLINLLRHVKITGSYKLHMS